jgi:hypothetical protein
MQARPCRLITAPSDLTFTRKRSLLREGCSWSCAPGRQDRIDPARVGCLDHDVTATSDDRHGRGDLHRVDLRSFTSACGKGGGCAPSDASRDRSGQEEERQDRCAESRAIWIRIALLRDAIASFCRNADSAEFRQQPKLPDNPNQGRLMYSIARGKIKVEIRQPCGKVV